MLGTFMTDINMGMYTAELDIGDCIYATSEQLRIRHHHYHDVRLRDFMERLVHRKLKRKRPQPPAPNERKRDPFTLEPAAPITITRLIRRLDEQLEDGTIIVADVGDALFASTALTTHNRTEFLAPAYYTSMGFATPAALGAQVARPEARVVAIVGDGAFQMTGMELSTLVRMKMPVVVIVLNNGGYGTERIALRRAISMAYNTDDDIRVLRRGQAMPATQPVPPGVSGYDPSYNGRVTYDPAAARALLDKFGYVDRDSDGWRELPDGKPLVLRMNSTIGTFERQTDELWRRSLNAIGVKVEFVKQKFPETLKLARAGQVQMWGLSNTNTTTEGYGFFGLLSGAPAADATSASARTSARPPVR
jgi:hypothetical protein